VPYCKYGNELSLIVYSSDAEKLGVGNWRIKARDRDGWRRLLESVKTLHGLLRLGVSEYIVLECMKSSFYNLSVYFNLKPCVHKISQRLIYNTVKRRPFCFGSKTENIFLALISNSDQPIMQDQCFRSQHLVHITEKTNKTTTKGNIHFKLILTEGRSTFKKPRRLVRPDFKRHTRYNRYVV
jgi:hypothetical protein